jgi:hypothetical protein
MLDITHNFSVICADYSELATLYKKEDRINDEHSKSLADSCLSLVLQLERARLDNSDERNNKLLQNQHEWLSS